MKNLHLIKVLFTDKFSLILNASIIIACIFLVKVLLATDLMLFKLGAGVALCYVLYLLAYEIFVISSLASIVTPITNAAGKLMNFALYPVRIGDTDLKK